MDKINALKDLKEKDFPAFFTVRNLIMIIDGSLLQPFFARGTNGKVLGASYKSTWH